MPRNDRSDSFSVRSDDDPRRLMKALQQETELEFGDSQARDSGGVEHQSAADRAGQARGPRPEERATQQMSDASEAPADRGTGPGGDTSASSPQRTRGEPPPFKQGA